MDWIDIDIKEKNRIDRKRCLRDAIGIVLLTGGLVVAFILAFL